MALRTSLVAQPHLYMGDSTGKPLDYGMVYFGQPNKDPEFYPINIYYDEALTMAAAQPVRTKGGFMNAFGDMVEVYAAETTYSVKVLDGYGRQVFYQASMTSENAELQAAKLDTGITATAKFGGVARTQFAKNMEVVTLGDFGAVGDGLTDDYLAVQNALDYLNNLGGGYLVGQTDKTYAVYSQLRLHSNITLDLKGATLLRCFTSSTLGTAFMGGVISNSAVINGVLDGNGVNYYSGFVLCWLVSSTNVVFDNITFKDVVDFHALDIGKSKFITVRNCTFLGFSNSKVGERAFSEAIQIDPSGAEGGTNEDILIEHCYCGANPDNVDARFKAFPVLVGNHSVIAADTVAKRITVKACTVDGATTAGIRAYAWDDIKIVDNYFYNCKTGIALTAGTSLKKQGVVTAYIQGNTIVTVGQVSGSCGIDMYSTGLDYMHRDINICSNIIQGSYYGIRLSNSVGISVHNNHINNVNMVLTTNGTSIKGLAFTNNSITSSDFGIYLTGAVTGLQVANNNFNGISNRTLHLTGETGALDRKNILITGNTFKSSASTVLQVDSGASSNIVVTNNTYAPDENTPLVKPTNLFYTTVTGGGVYFAGNYVPDTWLDVPSYCANGAILKTRFVGNPEGILTAGVGSTTEGTTGSTYTKYVKQTGTTNTGWVKFN